jgi:hypothetical protein
VSLSLLLVGGLVKGRGVWLIGEGDAAAEQGPLVFIERQVGKRAVPGGEIELTADSPVRNN